jgi:hypothetical protein
MWGRAEQVASDRFVLDDGSGTRPLVLLPGGVEAPQAGQFVAVTGVSSTSPSGTAVIPAIRIRSREDIRVFLDTGGAIAGRALVQGTRRIPLTMESPHPYEDNTNRTWIIRGPAGTARLRVHFTIIDVESGYDFLHIRDAAGLLRQSFSKGAPFSDVWSVWVEDDTVLLNLVTDSSITRFGFVVDQIEAEVRDSPLEGVNILLEPGGISKVTGADGTFRFEGLSPGTYTLSAYKPGLVFAPANRTVILKANQLADRQDFVATAE